MKIKTLVLTLLFSFGFTAGQQILVLPGLNAYDASPQYFDLSDLSKTCQDVPRFPKNVYGAMGSVFPDGSLVMCGGVDHDTFDDEYSDCYRLATSEEEWSHLGNMEITRYEGAAVTDPVTGKVWVTGGNIPGTELISEVNFLPLGLIETSDLTLPRGLKSHCVVNPEGTDDIFLLGGYVDYTTASYEAYKYDRETNDWARIPDMWFGVSGPICATTYDSQTDTQYIIVVGGDWLKDGKDRVSITQWYNLKTGEWNYANYQFPKAISDSTVAQVDKETFLILGGDDGGMTDEIWRYTFTGGFELMNIKLNEKQMLSQAFRIDDVERFPC